MPVCAWRMRLVTFLKIIHPLIQITLVPHADPVSLS